MSATKTKPKGGQQAVPSRQASSKLGNSSNRRWALLLEDDPAQFKTVKAFLETRVCPTPDEVVLVKTESDFVEILKRIDSNAEPPPDFVVSDAMMPWTSVDEISQNPPPADVKVGTYRRAGIRCFSRFRKREANRRIPWVFFTVLEEDHLRSGGEEWDRFTGYVKKNAPLKELADAIEEFAEIDRQWEESDDIENEKLRASFSLRLILLEGLRESLDDCLPSPAG